MAINRYELVSGHNPRLEAVNCSSPLTVGNGDFAFTADVTGLQSLYNEYRDLPLCTMSAWGWHTKPVSSDRYEYSLEDLVMSEYDYNGRTVRYPKKRMPGNEEVYDWLRQNPHRLNLGRIGFLYQGEPLKGRDLSDIHQELKLYEGLLVSSFRIHGVHCHVETACDYSRETLAVRIESEALASGELTLCMAFPYGSPDITASDWESENAHSTRIMKESNHEILIERVIDRDTYYVSFLCKEGMECTQDHNRIVVRTDKTHLSFTISFSPREIKGKPEPDSVFIASKNCWRNYWEKGGIVRLNRSKDPRAIELERRIILSQYLLAINSCGSTPPQETGLTCNSWYGKMHLEMYLWHCAWAPLWNHTELLMKSLPWFVEHIGEARGNAARNGYKGSRWPKMIATEGIDSPSGVAPLLVWQQPHIIFMLELAYRQNHSRDLLEEYWILIKETAAFMVDYVVFNGDTKTYEIVPPVIPVQECHRHDITRNPAFEVEYWRYTLNLAIQWADRLGKSYDPKWKEVADHMAMLRMEHIAKTEHTARMEHNAKREPNVQREHNIQSKHSIPMMHTFAMDPTMDRNKEASFEENLYIAHDNCPDTFTEYNRDHPSMLMAYGLLPNDRVDTKVMDHTLTKVIDCWQYPTLWGWDFAVMAMTATRLGKPETAIDILLIDSPKNDYVVCGHNRQRLRRDLPLYLPGNGSLLLAIPMMVAGYDGCDEETPGFPKNGEWIVEYENIERYV